MTKSSGPRTEPWGTPQEEVCREDRSVSLFTRKQRDDRVLILLLVLELYLVHFHVLVHVGLLASELQVLVAYYLKLR